MSRSFSEIVEDVQNQFDTNEIIGHVSISPTDYSTKSELGVPLHEWLAEQYPGIEIRIKL